jgi:hypothetical protein
MLMQAKEKAFCVLMGKEKEKECHGFWPKIDCFWGMKNKKISLKNYGKNLKVNFYSDNHFKYPWELKYLGAITLLQTQTSAYLPRNLLFLKPKEKLTRHPYCCIRL